MKTMTDIKRFASDIIEMISEYPAEVRSEAAGEFLEIIRRDEELTTQETQRLVAILDERGAL